MQLDAGGDCYLQNAFEGMQLDVMVVSYANKSQMRTQKSHVTACVQI